VSVETVIGIISTLAALGSAVWAYRSAEIAKKQLLLVNQKVEIITDPSKMSDILPTWYIERMAQDDWGFGLLLVSGEILAINRIVGISTDGKWIEVEMDDGSFSADSFSGVPVISGFSDRRNASVKVEQIQAAFEIATS